MREGGAGGGVRKGGAGGGVRKGGAGGGVRKEGAKRRGWRGCDKRRGWVCDVRTGWMGCEERRRCGGGGGGGLRRGWGIVRCLEGKTCPISALYLIHCFQRKTFQSSFVREPCQSEAFGCFRWLDVQPLLLVLGSHSVSSTWRWVTSFCTTTAGSRQRCVPCAQVVVCHVCRWLCVCVGGGAGTPPTTRYYYSQNKAYILSLQNIYQQITHSC